MINMQSEVVIRKRLQLYGERLQECRLLKKDKFHNHLFPPLGYEKRDYDVGDFWQNEADIECLRHKIDELKRVLEIKD
jgi:hypothetical protein